MPQPPNMNKMLQQVQQMQEQMFAHNRHSMLVVFQAFEAFKRGYRPARLFLAAWAMLLFGTAMYASVSFGALPKNFVTEYGIQIGSASEMRKSGTKAFRIRRLWFAVAAICARTMSTC